MKRGILFFFILLLIVFCSCSTSDIHLNEDNLSDVYLYDTRIDESHPELDNLDFDTTTINTQPNPAVSTLNLHAIMENGRDPGLGIKKLHEQGVTGKGISVAIIDSPLMTDHSEFSDRIVSYDTMHIDSTETTFHGNLVSSLSVGKTCGVAPESSLYYIACTPGEFSVTGNLDSPFTIDFNYIADSIEQIISINSNLPKSKKIRVLSISQGFPDDAVGAQHVFEAIKNAEKAGIFVISVSVAETYGFKVAGLGRDVNKSPNEPASYGLGIFYKEFPNTTRMYRNDNSFPYLYVPMDQRTFASEKGVNEYAFRSQGGLSAGVVQ